MPPAGTAGPGAPRTPWLPSKYDTSATPPIMSNSPAIRAQCSGRRLGGRGQARPGQFTSAESGIAQVTDEASRQVMDMMMARTKPKIAMSYRSVGSGTGGTEFAAYDSSAFGCGDVPISGANFNATRDQGNPMMHVPFLMGSVSIFHSVPGIGEGLYLPPCTLAKIFRGAITAWNDPEIVGANPQLSDLRSIGTPISVVHRNPGSSSTYALTHYFARACPEQWNKLAGVAATDVGPNVNQNRAVGVTTNWPNDTPRRWTTVTNSQGMVERIASIPYSLGYVESGQGLQAGLEEVVILNANGTRLVSSRAEIAPQPFIESQFPYDNLTAASWVDVNPVYAASASSSNQWPLTLGTYFYVRTNLSYLAETGGLLKLFLTFMLSEDVAKMLPEYGFVPLPYTVRQVVSSRLESGLTGLQPPVWAMENSTTQPLAGQRDFVFSLQRDSYLMSTVTGLAAEARDTRNTLKLGDAYQVHGAGSFVSALLLRHAMSILTGRARVPISMTYRTVGSVEAQAEFLQYDNMYVSYNHFKVGDMPLSSSDWASLANSSAALSSIGAVLQVPFALSALGLYHTKAVGRPALALNCTLLARFYSGDLTGWNDTQLLDLNRATSGLADTASTATITVYGMAAPSGATFALTGFLAKACGDVWRASSGPATSVNWPVGVTTRFNGTNITTPEQMLAALAATPNAVGYLPVSLGAASGLAEAALAVPGFQQPLLARQTDLSRAVVQARGENPNIFSNATADMAAVLQSSLYGQRNTWPMPMVQYIYMYRNLSGYGLSGPLLRAFVEFLVPGSLSAEGSQLVVQSGLTPMPEEVQAAMRRDVSAVVLKTLTVVWDILAAGVDEGDAGAALYTFSANRQSYDGYQMASLAAAVQGLRVGLAAARTAAVRVACTADTFGYVRLLRGDVQDMASSPLRILDEMGTAQAILAMFGKSLATPAPTSSSSTSSSSATQLLVHPGPLPAAAWRNLSLIAPVVQLPASIRPVAVSYRGPSGLRLKLCTLAKIIQGTDWDDPAIKADNPDFSALLPPKKPVSLHLPSIDDGDVQAVLQYVRRGAAAAGCPEYGNLTLPASAVTGGDPLAQLVAGAAAPFTSGVAFLAASALLLDASLAAGLSAAALPSTSSGTFVTPHQTPQTAGNASCADSGCPDVVARLYTTAVEAMSSTATGLAAPQDPTGDWSGFALPPLTGADVYPIVRFDFLVVPADLSKYGDDGAAVQGVVSYAASADFSGRMQRALAPYFCGLGSAARGLLVGAAPRQALSAAADSQRWLLVATSADEVTNPATTLVLGRVPSVSDFALAGSPAALLTAGAPYGVSTTNGNATNGTALALAGVSEVSRALEQLQLSYQAQYQDLKDKQDLAYGIAVAALVLGLVMSVAALALAGYVLAAARRGAGGGGGGGCLSPPAAKYQGGSSNSIEMRMLP